MHLAAGPYNHVAGGAINIEIPTGEGANVEDYYKMMVEANSSNPLFLKNYAQFLYQVKSKCPFCNFYSMLRLHLKYNLRCCCTNNVNTGSLTHWLK